MWRLLDDMDLEGKKRRIPTAQSGRQRADPHGRSIGDVRLAFQVLTGLLAVTVAWLAFRPAAGLDHGLPWDKANHALAFAVLTLVSARGWPGAGFWRLAAIMLLGGAAIEVVQGMPLIGRDRDGWDVVADMVGFGLGWAAVLGLSRLGRRIRE